MEKFANPSYFSIHLITGTVWGQAILFLIHAVFGIMLLVGYRTRLAVFFCWIFTLSLDVRNPMITQGGDTYFRMMLFWGMFLPLGSSFSLDRVLNPAPSKQLPTVFSVGSAAILLQIVIVYFFSFLCKTGPEWRDTGDAVYLTLGIAQYVRPLGAFLHQFPTILKPVTFFVLWLEGLGPLLFFSPIRTGPVRTFGVLLFFLMHLGFLVFVEIGIFPWVCMVGIVLFLPSWFWDKFIKPRSLPDIGRLIPWLKTLQMPKIRKQAEQGRLGIVKDWSAGTLAVIFLVYIFFWNLGSMDARFRIPGEYELLGRFLMLEQQWNMFSPRPMRDDGWYVIPADLEDGTQVDLFRDGQPVNWERPEWGYRLYKTDRWRKYMMNIWMVYNSDYRLYFGKYLCRHWNENLPDGKKLLRFDVFFMLEPTVLPGETTQVTKSLVWHHRCYDSPEDLKK